MQLPQTMHAPLVASAEADHGFAPAEVERIMDPIHRRGDRLAWGFILGHVGIAAILAPIYDTWPITVIWGGISTLAFWLCYRYAPGRFVTRAMAGVVLESFCALHIWQMHGQPEQHFWFFVGFTMMIVYQDWVCMWPGALLIIGQHTIFAAMHNQGANLHFFPEAHVSLTKLVFHFGIAIVHVAVCGYWAWLLKHQTLADARHREDLLTVQDRMRLEFRARQRAEHERRDFEVKMAESHKLESLGALAAGVAHDFNNLLAGILGNAAVATASIAPDSPVQEALSDIEEAATRAAGLTKQMLAYSGKGQFVVRPVSLAQEIEGLDSLLPTLLAKTTALRMELMRPSPWIEADASQFAQVVINLVVNGSEALEGKLGRVTVETTMLDVDAAWLAKARFSEGILQGPCAALIVTDDGPGMSPETLEKMFDPFYTTKFVGRGLGLSAVLGIVRGHGGAIRVDAAPGEGTKVTVVFPAVPAPVEPRPAVVAVPGATNGAAAPAAPPPVGTVLVVDDEELVRALAERMMQREGYRVRLAAGGREALALMEREGDGIDLVLLDLTMPDMHGREVLVGIQALKPGVPVVLSSGLDVEEARGLETGPRVVFLQKPYRMDQLLAAIQQVQGPVGVGKT